LNNKKISKEAHVWYAQRSQSAICYCGK
jgi:hypothetical protein